jgi:hypothetical protein
MNELIFENPKRLTPKDIYLQILFGLGILLLVGLVSPLRNHGQSFSWTSMSFLVFGGVLLVIWIFYALRETTLKAVEFRIENRKVIFVLDRQLRSDKVFEFQLNELHLDIIDVPDRGLPRKKILTIKDNQNELRISSRQKGLSEKIFNDIVEKLKHYPQQKI